MKFAEAVAVFLCLCLPVACHRMPEVIINGHRFEVELAVTPAERARGLMFRESLPAGRGMLFVFESEQPLSFWMRNTSVPLSIAYIDSNGVITDILDMEPFDLTSVPSSRPARYALEVNRGEFRKKGIRPGNRVILPAEVTEMRGNNGR